ncbi:hypothetical protein C8J56DRAFT_886953 [Mycena floridula]|nr:hypothetical protein C8J56DRAFT_886953 [Mycena floridula]
MTKTQRHPLRRLDSFIWAGRPLATYESEWVVDVKTVTCNGGNYQALSESNAGTTATFPTTVFTKTLNTAMVDASILVRSNGYQGFTEGEGNGGSTSRSSGTNELTRRVVAVLMSLAWIVVFVLIIAATFSS